MYNSLMIKYSTFEKHILSEGALYLDCAFQTRGATLNIKNAFVSQIHFLMLIPSFIYLIKHQLFEYQLLYIFKTA